MRVLLIVVALLAVALGATVSRKERSVDGEGKLLEVSENDKTENVGVCEHRTPCGWAVYKRFTRQIDFFMKNSCECPTGTSCARNDDDISVSAYVYRCAPTETQTKQGEHASGDKKDEQSVTGEESTSRTS